MRISTESRVSLTPDDVITTGTILPFLTSEVSDLDGFDRISAGI
jgi:hypothetical protein